MVCPWCGGNDLKPGLVPESWTCAECRSGFLPQSISSGERETIVPGSGVVAQESSGVHRIREERLPVDGQHVVHGELGSGGMGTVVSAEHTSMRREVAMKILRDTDDKRLRLRFIEEARITGQLEHPNIVPVHDLGIDQTSGRLFFTMKRVQGQTLEELLDEVRAGRAVERTELSHLLRVFIGTCNAIGFAHSRGVVHRDIKPANIMTGTFGEVLVMDWGLAKPGAVRGADDGGEMASRVVKALEIDQLTGGYIHPERPTMTLDGEIVGTIPYMPPEQADGRIEDIDERSDIYSLGAILYEILCLESPVGGGDADELLDRVIDGDFPSPIARAPLDRVVPADLAAVAMKALATDPEDRYQSVRDLRADVQRSLEGRSVSAKEDSAWEMVLKLIKRNRQVSAAVAVAALIIIGLSVTGYIINADARRVAEDSLASMRAAEAAREEAETARDSSDTMRHALIARIESENQRSWSEVYRGDLSDGSGWTVTSGWTTVAPLDDAGRAAQLTFGPDGLRLHSDRNLGIALNRRFGDDLRVTYRATYDGGEDGGMHVTLGGGDWRTGYGFQVGGWRNSRAAITRSEPWGYGPKILDSMPLTLDIGETYEIRATVRHRDGQVHLILEINGRVMLDTIDSRPLDPITSTTGGVALLANGPARSQIHEILVETLASPRKVSLIELAHQHLGRGNHRTAIDLFEEAAAVGANPEIRAEAVEGMELAQRMVAIEGELDEIRSRLEAAWSDSQIGLRLLGTGLSVSIVGGTQIRDLEPLAGLPVVDLRVDGGNLEDISHLRGMSLRSLWLRGVPVYDLSAITGSTTIKALVYMPRSRADGAGGPAVDLSIFSVMPLRILRVGDCRDADLTAIAGLRLEELSIGAPNLRSLAGLGDMPLLALTLTDAPLETLDGIQGLPLRSLGVNRAQRLRDISACAELPELRRLSLRNSAVSDLGPLAGLGLQSLQLGGTPVEDLSPLVDVPVENLELTETRVRDLSPIATPTLRRLNLAGSELDDLTDLAGCRLESLSIAGTRITNLAPLRGHPLARFDASETSVSDLSPLREAKIGTLMLRNSEVADLRPLRGQPLTFLDLLGTPLRALERIPTASLRVLRLPNDADPVAIEGLRDRNPGIQVVAGAEDPIFFPPVIMDVSFD